MNAESVVGWRKDGVWRPQHRGRHQVQPFERLAAYKAPVTGEFIDGGEIIF